MQLSQCFYTEDHCPPPEPSKSSRARKTRASAEKCERTAHGTVTHKIPAHLRVGYYEPEAGLRAYLFHRCRNQFEIWRIALGAADTGREKLRAALGMLRLSYRWKSDVYHDLYDVAGLIRGYLRARRKSIRPA